MWEYAGLRACTHVKRSCDGFTSDRVALRQQAEALVRKRQGAANSAVRTERVERKYVLRSPSRHAPLHPAQPHPCKEVAPVQREDDIEHAAAIGEHELALEEDAANGVDDLVRRLHRSREVIRQLPDLHQEFPLVFLVRPPLLILREDRRKELPLRPDFRFPILGVSVHAGADGLNAGGKE